ncbi:glutathione S-transferase, amine-terminal domain protein (macronuclear) [Tetrahymena thermophila SB210]|uniref:Glutathione S-transferase, amine-terminal domain protein n=1 Tax=Tetrahymena thermophila (strain SB210) TaxID=312017 RepID=I7M122_TETTS|nr:glutathione S-transferase, amine-terminal domain protein [Tetrahymena thermophila SB210]EAR93879.1 glutathione S-transferase, amine-terminal domain protein [Tetrahymena thermophila SB210]|eukprot:XP_001014124.1 glutathione S-transferase, amine-terminal domain protein [Tetrahymena thermophila SB210]
MDSSNTTNQIGKKQIQESQELIIGYLENASIGQTVRYILDLVDFPYFEHKYTSTSTSTEWEKQNVSLDQTSQIFIT